MPYLFSYGTLQQEEVQISTFGRKLVGYSDELPEFEQSLVKIENPEVVTTSGRTHHPIIKFTGAKYNCVNGTVFEVTDVELANADKYEVAAYKRVAVKLTSGIQAWVYVDSCHVPDNRSNPASGGTAP